MRIKNLIYTLLALTLTLTTTSSCGYLHIHQETLDTRSNSGRATNIVTKELQDKLTPYEVLERLKLGNKRFTSQKSIVRDYDKQRRLAIKGQHPKAIILSCVDSRVPVEDVFDQGIGDVFVTRVAGNFASTEIVGSIEYATAVAGVKLVLVLGHEHCGAIKAAIDGVDLGNISSLVEAINPAISNISDYKGKKTSKNPEFVHEVCENNVLNTIETIRQKSKIISKLEKEGRIGLQGAIYDLDTGIVSFM